MDSIDYCLNLNSDHLVWGTTWKRIKKKKINIKLLCQLLSCNSLLKEAISILNNP